MYLIRYFRSTEVKRFALTEILLVSMTFPAVKISYLKIPSHFQAFHGRGNPKIIRKRYCKIFFSLTRQEMNEKQINAEEVPSQER